LAYEAKGGSLITPKQSDEIILKKYKDKLPDDKQEGGLGEKGTKVLADTEFRKVYDEAFGDDGEYDLTIAFAAPSSGEVFIHRERANEGTPYHETLHLYSNDEYLELGKNMIEGTTEYFTRKETDGRGINRSGIYDEEMSTISALADVVGDDVLEQAYFSGDVDGLKEAVDKKVGQGGFDKFQKAMSAGDFDDAKKALKPSRVKT